MKAAKQRGYSLIELLVVVAIIGVLAAVGVIGYTKYIDSARRAVVNEQGKKVFDALKAVSLAREGNLLSALTPECGFNPNVGAQDSSGNTNTVLACAQSIVTNLQNVYGTTVAGSDTFPVPSLNSNPIVVCDVYSCPDVEFGLNLEVPSYNPDKIIDCSSTVTLYNTGEPNLPRKGLTMLIPFTTNVSLVPTDPSFIAHQDPRPGAIPNVPTIAVVVCESDDSEISMSKAFKGFVTFK